MALPQTACPILVLLSGEGGVLLAHPPEAFAGEPPQTLLDLGRVFRPHRGGIPEPFAPERFRDLGREGLSTQLCLPGKPRWEGRLTALRWCERPGGLRTLMLWQPDPPAPQMMKEDAAQRLAGRIRGLVGDARKSLGEARGQGALGEAHLEHLILLFERAEGLLACLSGEETRPGRGIEVLEGASH